MACSWSRRTRAARSEGKTADMAREMVCHGSNDDATAVVAGRREGEAERYGAPVPMGAKVEELDEGALLLVLLFDMTTELRRRG